MNLARGGTIADGPQQNTRVRRFESEQSLLRPFPGHKPTSVAVVQPGRAQRAFSFMEGL